MRDLKFGMYENLRDYSLGALLQRYKTELLILLTILLFLPVFSPLYRAKSR